MEVNIQNYIVVTVLVTSYVLSATCHHGRNVGSKIEPARGSNAGAWSEREAMEFGGFGHFGGVLHEVNFQNQ